MNLRKLGVGLLLLSHLYGAIFAYSNSRQTQNFSNEEGSTEKKKALIFCPETYSKSELKLNEFDEGMKNASLINIANVHNSLLKKGYSSSDITIFFGEGVIDKTEKRDSGLIQNMSYSKILPAKKDLLEKKMAELSGELDRNDEFTMLCMGHAYKTGTSAYLDISSDKAPNGKNSRLYPEELKLLSDKIDAGKEYYVFESCYSENFSDAIGGGNQIAFSSSAKNSPSVISRSDSFSKFLFSSYYDVGSDVNKDGFVSDAEAFYNAQKIRNKYIDMHIENMHIFPDITPKKGYFGTAKNLGD